MAPNATDLTIDWTGGALIGRGSAGDNASLGKIKNLTLNLENASNGTADGFNFSSYDLVAAQNVIVNGGGETVRLGGLGTAGTGNDASSNLTLDVSDVASFEVGDIGVGLGQYVQATIESSGTVGFGKITSSTNAQNNTLGDVFLEVSGSGFGKATVGGVTDLAISGGDLTLDFSGITAGATGSAVGGSAAGEALVLNAQGGITYTGAAGKDYLEITGVGEGSTSNISTGGGQDSVTFDFSGVKFSKGTARATINLDLGANDGVDTVELKTSGGLSQGVVVINLENFEVDNGGDALKGYAGSFSHGGIGDLAKFGISGDVEDVHVWDGGSGGGGTNGVRVGNDVYVFNATTASGATVAIKLQGAADHLDSTLHLQVDD